MQTESLFNPIPNETLFGLSQVCVFVQLAPLDLCHIVDDTDISRAIEQHCQSRHLHTVNDISGAGLWVNVSGLKCPSGFFSYTVRVTFSMPAVLAKDHKTEMAATAWEWQKMYVVSESIASEKLVKNQVLAAVDEFLAEWEKANRKPRTTR